MRDEEIPAEPERDEFSSNQEGLLRLPAGGSRSGQASTGSGRTDPPSPEASADEREEGRDGPSTDSGRADGDPPSRRAAVDGDERICAAKHRALQVTRAGKRKLFDKKARKAFLEWFAATGNVIWSAQKIGFSDKTVWKHRMNDPRFAEAFDRAFEQSVVRNKARMLERKAKPIALDGGVGEAELEDCDLEKAWPLIVEIERAKGKGGGDGRAPIGRPSNRGRAPRAASNAEVRKELTKRLKAFGRRMRAEGKEPPAWLPPVEPRKSGKRAKPAPDTPPPPCRWSPSPSCDGEDEE